MFRRGYQRLRDWFDHTVLRRPRFVVGFIDDDTGRVTLHFSDGSTRCQP